MVINPIAKGRFSVRTSSVFIIIVSSLLPVLWGCATQLTGQFRGVSSLGYIMDSKECSVKQPVTIKFMPVIDNTGMGDTITVKGTSFVIPLVALDFWGSNYHCVLGRNSIDRPIAPFFYKSFESEAKRSGCFRLIDSDSADYTCQITLSKGSCVGPYSHFGGFYFLVFAFGFFDNHSAGPGVSTITMDITLTKKSSPVFKKKFISERKTEMLTLQHNRLDELQNNFISGLVESFSFAMKDCIEQGVKAIDSVVVQH